MIARGILLAISLLLSAVPALAFIVHMAELEDVPVIRGTTRIATTARQSPAGGCIGFDVVGSENERLSFWSDAYSGRYGDHSMYLVYNVYDLSVSSATGPSYETLLVSCARRANIERAARCPIYFDVQSDLQIAQAIVPSCGP